MNEQNANPVELFGMRVAHVGINATDPADALEIAELFSTMMGLPVIETPVSYFNDSLVEIMKQNGRGTKGHIGFAVNDIDAAEKWFAERGLEVNEESRALLAGIGVDNVVVAGDTRFDRVTDILEDHTDLPVVESFSRGAFTLFVGSSWQPDEDFIIPYFNKHPEMKMVLAPHEISEDRISGILTGLKRPAVRYTKTTPEEAAEADCLIIDCYGILSKSYRFATVAYVGGGFGVGIHNINEAAVYGIPVVFGPKYGKFKEARDLIALEGAFTVSGGDEYALVMNRLLSDGEYLKKHGEIAGGYIRHTPHL